MAMIKRLGPATIVAGLAVTGVLVSTLVDFGHSDFRKIAQFEIPHARQAIAVNNDFLFGIDDAAVGKYDKKTGVLVASWSAPAESHVQHLNSGIILDEKLLAAHSNYPDFPIENSIESWSPESLEHVGTRKISGRYGYAVWVDWHGRSWWVAFAHYEKTRPMTGFGSEKTTLVRFDDDWNELDSWVYPSTLIDRMAPKSNSGGAWGPHGVLFLTGHDAAELYAVIPERAKGELTLLDVLPVDNAGQGIAWDPVDSGTLFAMKREGRIVTRSKLEVSWFRRISLGTDSLPARIDDSAR